MATRLDDAKIRVILDLTGAQGGGGDGGGAPGSPDGGDADGRGGKSPDGPPIPGTPTPEERERRRPRTPPNAPSPSIMPDGGEWTLTNRGAPRPGQTILDATALGLRRGAPAGMRSSLLGLGTRAAGSVVATEELLRNFMPIVTAMVEQSIKELLPDLPMADDANLGIADYGQAVNQRLNQVVQTLPATITATSRTYAMERGRMLLGGQFREGQVFDTFAEEWDIAYQRDLAEARMRAFGGRLVGESLGKELGRRVRQNMGR